MTNNSDRQREIEELIERLMAEKHNRTSAEVITNNSKEWDHDHAVMRYHAAPIILTELGCRPPGTMVPKDFMERHILRSFLASHPWRESLELRLNGGILKWANAVDWARGDLVKDKFLMKAPDVPGSGYQLVTGAEHMVQEHLREQEVQALRARHELADESPKKNASGLGQRLKTATPSTSCSIQSDPTAARSELAMATAKREKPRRNGGPTAKPNLFTSSTSDLALPKRPKPQHVNSWNWLAIESTTNGSSANGRWLCRFLKP